MVNVIVTGNAVCLKSHFPFAVEPCLHDHLSIFARHKSARLTNAAQPYRENKHNSSRNIRDAMPDLLKRPGRHSDIVVLKYYRDSMDTYEDVLQVVEEIWSARRSSFLPKADPENDDEEVDIDFAIHLGMTTAVPEFRAENHHKISHRLPSSPSKATKTSSQPRNPYPKSQNSANQNRSVSTTPYAPL